MVVGATVGCCVLRGLILYDGLAVRGLAVGLFAGLTVGLLVRLTAGCFTGKAVGLPGNTVEGDDVDVGETTGLAVGTEVGAVVGMVVGSDEGLPTGLAIGTAEGDVVGVAVGVLVGVADGKERGPTCGGWGLRVGVTVIRATGKAVGVAVFTENGAPDNIGVVDGLPVTFSADGRGVGDATGALVGLAGSCGRGSPAIFNMKFLNLVKSIDPRPEAGSQPGVAAKPCLQQMDRAEQLFLPTVTSFINSSACL